MNQKRNPDQEPSCSENFPTSGRGEGADPVRHSAPSRTEAVQNAERRSYGGRKMLKGSAGRAELSADDAGAAENRTAHTRSSSRQDDIAAILEEVEQKKQSRNRSLPHDEYSSDEPEASAVPNVRREEAARKPRSLKAEAEPMERRKSETHTALRTTVDPEDSQPQKKGKKKKKNHYSFRDILKNFIPWKGDSVFEATRKIVFSTALVVVGVCTFLISSYYIDLYKAKQEYNEIQARIEEARKNRSFKNDNYMEDPVTGEVFEYLEYNWVADKLLSQNPDLVGYVEVPGTVVSYPVVQKKSKDISINMNDYYLYRTFHQESSNSGCIFMDYRCHFDEVVDHRRIVDNSGSVFIYGHNMNNRTMFGSLRDYVSNPSFYMEHPLVEYSSLYNDYEFKIFSIFIVDGEDFESEYAFDAWNTLDFADENEFYDYVNEAKKRTTITTNVDVEYGDQLLSLYTCNGLCSNAKLILMCREVRAGEDPLEGTENATLNENVLYPTAYYNYGHPVNYDPKKFVPYGPKS